MSEREGGSGEERIVLRKFLSAPASEVFAAWTDAEEMREWMRPSTTTDLRASLEKLGMVMEKSRKAAR